MITEHAVHVLSLLTQAPTPIPVGPAITGTTAPPGADKLLLMGRWVLWICAFAAGVGFMVLGVKLIYAWQHGELAQQGKAWGAAAVGCVLIAAASSIAGTLIGV